MPSQPRGVTGSSMERRAIGTLQLAVAAIFAGTFGAFSTTDMVTIWTMGYTDFWIQDKAAHLYVPTSFKVAHSIAGGRFHFRMYLYNLDDAGVLSNGAIIFQRLSVACPLANEWVDYSPTPFAVLNSRTPGRHRLYWTIQGGTAGTLYVGAVDDSQTAAGFLLGTVAS